MKRLLSLRNFFTLLAALGIAAGASAQQYKWVDKDGKVRYGDIPPPGARATPLRSPSAPAPQPQAAPDKKGGAALSPAQQEAEFRKRQLARQEEEENAAKARAEAQAKRANCARAEASLRGLQSGQRIATTNKAGEREYLDDAQREKEMERAQRAVKEWCS
jgi:hypothetical protein